jgi:hypothetical protein
MGHLVMDKWKNETTKFCYCQEKAKPQIYKTWYKILSLGNVQTRDGIFETMRKPKKNHSQTITLLAF